MHLVIGIICITATLIFNESKSVYRMSMHRTLEAARESFHGYVQSACSASWCGNVTAHKAPIAEDVLEEGPS